jgi:polysaccharide export outer membrane protein
MKQIPLLLAAALLLASSCTSQKQLAYLNNLPVPTGEEKFTMSVPDYKIQNRDILYITVKAMNPEGVITDFLGGSGASGGAMNMQGESGGFLYGYDVKTDGNVILPVLGSIYAEGKTLEEIRITLQEEFSKHYKNAIVECKLLSFKFTVIGEVKAPGTYTNFNNYLTVLEAIGRAGGVGDYGKRDRVLVVRPMDKGTKTYILNLQDKAILSSEAYFLLPNDVVIIEPLKQKIFNMNLQTYSFLFTTSLSMITTTLLLIKFFGK